MNIKNCIKLLSYRNEKNHDVYIGEGVFVKFVCKFSSGASSAIILEFENEINKKLPSDYREFLSICNGLSIFEFNDFELFSIDKIRENTSYYSLQSGFYVIANCAGENIVMNLNQGENFGHIFVMSDCADGCIQLETSFTDFFWHVSLSSGTNYWVKEFFYSMKCEQI